MRIVRNFLRSPENKECVSVILGYVPAGLLILCAGYIHHPFIGSLLMRLP